MEFDFYSKYQELDTEHLLALVAAPEKMQPAAIEAALKVLAEREVTEQEINERKSLHQTAVIAEVQRQKERKQSKFFDYLEKTFFDQDQSWDFEEEEAISLTFTPEERRGIIRRLLMLLLLPALQAVVVLVAIVSFFWIAIAHSVSDEAIFFNLLALLLALSIVVSISWFLLKRKKGAWSIMLIYAVYHVANNIFRLYQLTTDVGFDFVSTYQLIVYLVMTPLGVYSIFLLNKKSIISAFELSRKRIENTWAIAILLPVVLFFIIYLYT